MSQDTESERLVRTRPRNTEGNLGSWYSSECRKMVSLNGEEDAVRREGLIQFLAIPPFLLPFLFHLLSVSLFSIAKTKCPRLGELSKLEVCLPHDWKLDVQEHLVCSAPSGILLTVPCHGDGHCILTRSLCDSSGLPISS